MRTCRIAVVVPTFNEKQLGRAMKSLRSQVHKPAIVYIMDDGTYKWDPKRALRAALHESRKRGLPIEYVRNDGEPGNPGKLRAHAIDQICTQNIDVVAFLDADDALGPNHLHDIARAYEAARGEIDVFYPQSLVHLRANNIHDPHKLEMPRRPDCLDELTDSLVDAWVQFTLPGASFAITTDTFRRLGLVHSHATEDEWCVLLTKLAVLDARFGCTDSHGSYLYTLLPLDADPNKRERRELIARTRHETVCRILAARCAV